MIEMWEFLTGLGVFATGVVTGMVICYETEVDKIAEDLKDEIRKTHRLVVEKTEFITEVLTDSMERNTRHTVKQIRKTISDNNKWRGDYDVDQERS